MEKINLSPMLLSDNIEPFDDPDWLFEYKWDGFRALIFIENEKVNIISRNQKKLNYYFPELLDLGLIFKPFTVLDGEIIACEGKKGSFSLIRKQKNILPSTPIKYILFDILYFEGKKLLHVPLIERKLLLPILNEKIIKTAEYKENMGIELFKSAQEENYEGIVAKKKNSLYLPGKRSRDWVKIKCLTKEKFIVLGFKVKLNKPISIIITDHKKSFSQELYLPYNFMNDNLLEMLQDFVIEKKEDIIVLKPVLGAIVSYLEKTQGNKLRHAKLCGFLPLKEK